MAHLIFNKRLLQGIVAVAHAIIIVLLVAFLLSLDASTFSRVEAISAVQNGYNLVGLNYFGHVRDVGHSVAALCGFLIGYRLIAYGMSRTHEVTRFFAVALGTQVLLGAAMNVALVGLVWFGGAWHMISMFLAAIEAASMLITTSVMTIYWNSLIALGRKQDKAITETTDQ